LQPLVDCPNTTFIGTVSGEGGAIYMRKQRPRRVTPIAENGTVPPRRKRNEELRPREYLTPAEIERLMKVAGDNRYGHRDSTMILIAYRHGLRPAEACGLKAPCKRGRRTRT
jgi:integrase